jgi:hypothetical protein
MYEGVWSRMGFGLDISLPLLLSNDALVIARTNICVPFGHILAKAKTADSS